MDWALIIGLIVAGLILLLLEILVIPGTGIVGLFGIGLIGYSIFRVFNDHGPVNGLITVTGTLTASVALVWIALRSKTWKKISLSDSIESRVNQIDLEKIKIGDRGIAISRITPIGKARFGDEFYEVRSTGNFIDQQTHIEVIRIEGNKIFIKPIENQENN